MKPVITTSSLIDVPLNLRFWFRPRRLSKPVIEEEIEGQLTIMIQVGKSKLGPFSTNITCFKRDWHPGLNCSINPGIHPRTLEDPSEQLNRLKVLLHKAKEYIRYQNPPVTAQKIWDLYEVMQANNGEFVADTCLTTPFLQRWEECIEQKDSSCKQGFISKSTVKNYRKLYRMFSRYAEESSLTGALPQQIDNVVLLNYRQWLFEQKKKDGQPYDLNYISKACLFVKAIINYCIERNYCEKTGTEKVKLSWKRVGKAKYAKEKHIQQIKAIREEARGRNKLYFNALTAFLFASETCLHWIDYYNLREEYLQDEESEYPYIEKARNKTDIMQTVFLSPLAKEILEECGGINKLPKLGGTPDSGYKQVCAVLKQIREYYEIPNLSFSLGRKTYLTRMHNQKNASPITIMETAGWTSFHHAKHYIHPDRDALKRNQLGE